MNGAIATILRENGLSDYLEVFQRNHVTDSELPFLEEAHLKELGIPLGPRLKICSALRGRPRPLTKSPQTQPMQSETFSKQLNCKVCFHSPCTCASDLSAILEFSAFGSRSASFSPFGSPPASFSQTGGIQSLFSGSTATQSLFSHETQRQQPSVTQHFEDETIPRFPSQPHQTTAQALFPPSSPMQNANTPWAAKALATPAKMAPKPLTPTPSNLPLGPTPAVPSGKAPAVAKDASTTPAKLEVLPEKNAPKGDTSQQELKTDAKNDKKPQQATKEKKKQEKLVESAKSVGISERMQKKSAEVLEANKGTVATANAFDILDESEEDVNDTKKVHNAKLAKQEPEKKLSAKNDQLQKTPIPTPAPTPNKPKCECGQIVHPSVLNPVTEFQQQDRQAHLSSKRHQTFVSQQEALQRKERQEKLKQEKACAQKAKEEAQKAKEEAQRAIEAAQKFLEAKQVEDANLSPKTEKKKPKKKKERKVSLVHPLGGEIIEENTMDIDKAKTAAFDPKKKQLASEIQQEANQLYNKGLYAKAVERYTDGIVLNPKSAVLFSNRAQAHTRCLQYEQAIADCRKSLELDPTFAKSYHRASACYIKLGDLKEAKLLLARCHMICPNDKKDDTPAHIKLVEDLEASLAEATRLMHDKQYEEVIDVLQTKVTCQMPEAPLPNYMLAEAYIRVGDFIAADDVAGKFFERCPNLPATRIVKALFAYYEEAKLDRAMELLKSVIAEDAENMKCSQLLTRIQKIDSLKKLADGYLADLQYPKAIDAFTEALAVDRENNCLISTLLCCRAGTYFSMGLFVEAKKDLDEAISYAGNHLKAHHLRANVNEKLGAWQGVVEDCRFVLDEEWDARCNEMMSSAKQRKPCLDYKGYYAALALPVTAKTDEIAKAYKERITRWDPKKWAKANVDQRTSAELQYQALSQAYSVLSDPAKRSKYDNFDCDENEAKCDCCEGVEIIAFF